MLLLCIITLISAVLICYIFYVIIFHEEGSTGGGSIDSYVSVVDDSVDATSVAENNHSKYAQTYDTPGRQILIIYGTEYGFSEEVARCVFDKLEDSLQSADEFPWQLRLLNAKHHDNVHLEKEQVLLVIISTAGDGVPPTEARPFVNALSAADTIYNHLAFSVLSLGDSNYPHFCRAGRTLRKRLCAIGGEEIVTSQDIDTDDWSTIRSWLQRVIDRLPLLRVQPRLDYLQLTAIRESGHSRSRPFMVTLTRKTTLTKMSNSYEDKETIHCEFSRTNSKLTWISGDAVGIYPTNAGKEVERLLQAMACTGKELVSVPRWAYEPRPSGAIPLHSALAKYYDLKHVKEDLLQFMAERSNCSCKESKPNANPLTALLLNVDKGWNTKLQSFMAEREVADVLFELSVDVSDTVVIGEFLKYLRPLQPRFYSISSPGLGGELCVTAAVVRYTSLGLSRQGVTTTFLQDRLSVDQQCPIFISANPDFRLPCETRSPVIMIGPGTGLAPFMAFISERAVSGGSGRNRLYFGCRHKEQDYIYQKELERWEEDHFLELRIAFSRDQPEKQYVQHLIVEDAHILWPMMRDQQAHVYVCGDAQTMAHDVHQALVDVINKHMERSEAIELLARMEKESRYQRDVWIT